MAITDTLFSPLFLSIFIGGLVIYVLYNFFSNSSGSKAPVPIKEPEKDDVDDGRPRMLILYGSQTGTAEEFSHTLAGEAKRFGFRPAVMDLVDFNNPEEQFQQEQLVIFVVATYGEGEPTDNARDFYEWVKDETLSSSALQNVNYAVFGLGNKQYKIFNAMGLFFDKRLEELGAKRAFEKGEGDADDNIEEHFEDWKSRLLPELSAQFKTNSESGDEVIEQKYEMKTVDAKLELAKIPYDMPRSGLPDSKNPFFATVIANRQLLKNTADRSTVHVEFDIKGSKMSYEAGDHLAVFSENEDALVQEYATRLGILDAMDKIILMVPRKQKEKPPYFPKRATIGTALKYYLDLTGLPRKKVLKVLAQFAKDDKEKQELISLSSNTDEGKMKFKSFIKDASRTLLDVLNTYKSVDIPIDFFLESVPRLQARYYSIASSSRLHQHAIHIVVAVVRYKSSLGVQRKGVCSSFLERLQPGQKAYVYVRQSAFHLPSDATKPVIMVGPGTGLAPFVGFLQQRTALLRKGTTLGDAALYFGCRKQNEDWIYEDEQRAAEKEKAISKLHVAFSREQNSKVYVQHLLLENKQQVYDALERGGSFYVCGDAKNMARDVDKALIEIVRTVGNKTQEDAVKYVDKLGTTSKYLRDVWAPS